MRHVDFWTDPEHRYLLCKVSAFGGPHEHIRSDIHKLPDQVFEEIVIINDIVHNFVSSIHNAVEFIEDFAKIFRASGHANSSTQIKIYSFGYSEFEVDTLLNNLPSSDSDVRAMFCPFLEQLHNYKNIYEHFRDHESIVWYGVNLMLLRMMEFKFNSDFKWDPHQEKHQALLMLGKVTDYRKDLITQCYNKLSPNLTYTLGQTEPDGTMEQWDWSTHVDPDILTGASVDPDVRAKSTRTPDGWDHPDYFYKTHQLEIVAETDAENRCSSALTEKTYRPIIMGMPFLADQRTSLLVKALGLEYYHDLFDKDCLKYLGADFMNDHFVPHASGIMEMLSNNEFSRLVGMIDNNQVKITKYIDSQIQSIRHISFDLNIMTHTDDASIKPGQGFYNIANRDFLDRWAAHYQNFPHS